MLNHYTIISRANLLINDAPDSGQDQAVIDRIVGEAKFLRSFAYLVSALWGPVPVTLAPKPRSFESLSVKFMNWLYRFD